MLIIEKVLSAMKKDVARGSAVDEDKLKEEIYDQVRCGIVQAGAASDYLVVWSRKKHTSCCRSRQVGSK